MKNIFREPLKCFLLLAVLLAAALTYGCAAWAAAVAPGVTTLKDFVHARELKTTLEGALHKVPIPEFVYKGLIQSQHRDLAVFNAIGETVPFVVDTMSPIYDTSASQSGLSVPFFELPAEGAGQSGAVGPLDIYVRTGVQGQVVEVKGAPAPKNGPGDRRYLLDFSSLATNEAATSYSLQLSVPEGMKLAAEVSVYQSGNLRDWEPVVSGAPLIQLQNKDASLASDSVRLPAVPSNYLLLQIKNVDAAFELQDVRYSFTSHSSLIKDERTLFEGVLTEDKRAVEYDTSGAFPVSKVNFVLQEPGLYKVRYSSRADRQSPWHPIGSMELSMIREPSSKPESPSVRMNPSVSLDAREDRYWRIDFDKAFSGLPPKMRIGWRSCEVYFLAQGRAPYFLAFGSSRKGLSLQNPSLLQDKSLRASAAEAEIGAPVDPSRESFLAPGGEKAGSERFDGVEWQRYLVWGLLVLGGFLLSGMAWKLMKNGSSK